MSGIQKHGDTRTVRYFGGYFLGIFTIAVDEMRHLRWVDDQMSPASISLDACSAVAPQVLRFSVIAQSSEDGPRSPFIPGWMIMHVWSFQMSSGTLSFRNGQIIKSGWHNSTATRI